MLLNWLFLLNDFNSLNEMAPSPLVSINLPTFFPADKKGSRSLNPARVISLKGEFETFFAMNMVIT